MPDTSFPSVAAAARAIAARTVSPVELVESTLRRIERLNPTLNAFITVREAALDEARSAERGIGPGRSDSLLGIPISVKDLILTRGDRTTAGSRIFGDGLESDHDAPVVQRLRDAGAIIVGKNNLHEVALGVTNLNEHFGPARNPWDLTRVPGGSSGGSAVAVAAGLGLASVGSDTRGSIRIPAACCGVTGLKPTFGLVPTDDVIPLGWSLDHVGPLTRTVEDAALMLGVMAGGAAAAGYRAALEAPIATLRAGVCEYFLRDLDPVIENAVNEALKVFTTACGTVRSVTIPELEGSHGFSGIISLAQAVTYHDRTLRERSEGFGPAVRARLEAGYRLSAMDLVRAERHRAAAATAFERAFDDVDFLIGATLPAFPAPIGDDRLVIRGRETNVLAEYPRLTCPANLTCSPALSLPCGFGDNGLPIGLQLMAARGREDVLFTAGAYYQSRTDWHSRTPVLQGTRRG